MLLYLSSYGSNIHDKCKLDDPLRDVIYAELSSWFSIVIISNNYHLLPVE